MKTWRLVGAGTPFPKTHDLLALKNLLTKASDLGLDDGTLAELSSWAADIRYPGDASEATQADADEALNQARKIVATAAAVMPTGDLPLDKGDR